MEWFLEPLSSLSSSDNSLFSVLCSLFSVLCSRIDQFPRVATQMSLPVPLPPARACDVK
jgi:hypothetical protein